MDANGLEKPAVKETVEEIEDEERNRELTPDETTKFRSVVA